jgi:hypothetical protein
MRSRKDENFYARLYPVQRRSLLSKKTTNHMKKSCLNIILLISAGLFLSGGLRGVAQTAPIASISGHGFARGPYDITVSAQLTSNGATGYVRLVGGVTGPVIQIAPPGDDHCSCWCLNIKRTDTLPVDGDQRANLYIRDSGDGQANFDQFTFITSVGGECGSFPTDSLFLLTLDQGDFKVVVADTDEDGVPDYKDRCAGTAPGAAVDEAGCSIDQLVPCEGPWKNHREYVAAVTATADAFLAAGLITSQERDAVVRAARRSTCGRN